MKHRLHILKKGDFIVFGIIVFLAAVVLVSFFLPKGGKKICLITQNNVIIKEISLSPSLSEQIHLSGDYENDIEIKDGYARFVSSTCPNQLCVHSGKINRSGQSLVCLPNRVVVRITSTSDTEVDIVAQ